MPIRTLSNLVGWRRFKWRRRLFIVLLLLASLFVTLWLLDRLYPLPLPDGNRHFAQVVTDQHGEPLRVFADRQGIWRYPVTLQQVAPEYLEALINYEDRWFYQHNGVNPLALLRALGQWIYYGKPVSGGSTLTMQVARILQPHDKSLAGKVQQIFRALQLEWHFSKQEILTLYLNYAPFGGPIEGVQAASYTFLGKPASQLTHAEAALLAVLPQLPSRLRPDRYPQRARMARDKVLLRLQHFGVWQEQTVAEAIREPVIAQFNSAPQKAPLLARRLAAQYPDRQIIHSTIDAGLQSSLRLLVRDYIAQYPEKTSAALVLIDNASMSVKAYLGSADFANDERFGHVDMIQATRSPGSTLKPFLYAMALDSGLIHEQSMLLDVPSNFEGYRPENFTRGFSGAVSVREALQRSLNVPAVQVLQHYSPRKFYAGLANAGVALSLPDMAEPNLSMILGGAGSSLENLTQLFASFGRKGRTAALNFVVDAKAIKPAERKLMSAESAWIIQDILRSVPIDLSSRHAALETQRSRRIAFKTGTSYGFRDAWVLAVSEKVTIGLWIGRPDGTPLVDNNGRRNAVPLLKKVLRLLPAELMSAPEKPDAVTREVICWPLGTLKQLQQQDWCLQQHSAWLKHIEAPVSLKEPAQNAWAGFLKPINLDKTGARVHAGCKRESVDSAQIAVWPTSIEPWLPYQWQRQQRLPPMSPDCQTVDRSHQITIVGLQPDAELYPKPGADQTIELELQLMGHSGYAHWFLDGEWQGKSSERDPRLRLKVATPGEHRLTVMDESGQQVAIQFYLGAS